MPTHRIEVDPVNWIARDVKLIGVHSSIPKSVVAGTPKRYPAAFKARIARKAAKQTGTLAELSNGSTTRNDPISPWPIGPRGRSIEPMLADADLMA